jgi:hypothetical protein
MAPVYYLTAVAVVFGTLLVAGLIDLGLDLTGQGTMSVWLRTQPLWFWVPAVVLVVFLVALGIHLFVPAWSPFNACLRK